MPGITSSLQSATPIYSHSHDVVIHVCDEADKVIARRGRRTAPDRHAERRGLLRLNVRPRGIRQKIGWTQSAFLSA
jgi:hypothetical protein